VKAFREILNILIGLAVIISLLVGIPSIVTSLNGHTQDIQGAVIFNSILVASLIFAYILNKPNNNLVLQKFYNAKWLTALSTLVVTAICLPVFFVTNLIVGLSVSFGILVLVLKFVVGPLWRCPVCQTKLPYLSNGKPGFSIKECPSCDAVLSES